MPSHSADIIKNLPKPLIIDHSRALIHQGIQDKHIIVLDDDPTGCQTVHGIHVLLQWDEPTLKKAIENYGSFYILHNTRSLTSKEAFNLNLEISNSLLKLAPKEKLTIISRSDSTLRGHFIPEISALKKTTGPFDGILVVPYFKEGGRLTINNEHFVDNGQIIVPASETEFANDPVFGFSTSNLPDWIEEKTKGKTKSQEVLSISLHDIRIGGIENVKRLLSSCSDERYIVVNATQDEDLDVLIHALLEIEKEGKRFLIRSAASLVKVILGLEDIPLWKPGKKGNTGVIIAGSHVKKTSEQLKMLMESHDLNPVVLSIDLILHDKSYFQKCIKIINQSLDEDKTVLIYTERKYQLSGSDQDRLNYGRKISDFLSGLINNIENEPDFIVAKGGITSNDVAKYGLEIVDAEVLGQIQPGIPVWQPGPESKFPNCMYIVFPGNVGNVYTLKNVYEILTTTT